MLTRLRVSLRRDFRVFVRTLADKPSDSGNETPNKPENTLAKDNTKSKEKMQELLKLMMSESKNKEKLSATSRSLSHDAEEVKMEKIEESLTKAAGHVAEAIGGDVKHTEAELLSRVLGKINQTSTNLSDLLIGMKVDRTQGEGDDLAKKETRGQQVKRMVEQTRYKKQKTAQRSSQPVRTFDNQRKERSQIQAQHIDVMSGGTIGIFKPTQEPNYGTKLSKWQDMKQRDLLLATTQPPANYFQKMILWTQQGKVWQFPINNEQGMEEEQNVHFSEHIFLDTHLEDWCPTKGPIRHFMELVCVGLSKNAFYTAEEKKDHIMWYKEYFESKKSLLKEVGVWEGVPQQRKEASV